MVRVARFERAASSSQSWRPTNWATPGNMKFWRLRCYYTTPAVVVKHVVMDRVFRETQGRGSAPKPSKIRAPQLLHHPRRTACVHAPKAGALPTGLHPDIRQKKLAAFRFSLAAKTAHPLLPSSSPNRTRFAGLRFGLAAKKKLATFRFRLAAKAAHAPPGAGERRPPKRRRAPVFRLRN